jgi:NitT/TauT family transport system substrate-binding protein
MHKKLLLFIIIILLTGINHSQTSLKRAAFIPHWLPQSQFAGYYVAFEKGIYKKYGIDLKILTGGPKKPVTVAFEKKEADFASMWLTNALELKDKGVSIVNIGQYINKSTLMLVTKKSSGINKPEDMNGKKVGIWGGDYEIQPKAFFEKYNLKVSIIPQNSSINLFLMDGVNVTSAMWYNEYHTILNAGINPDELNTFYFSDYGLNLPEDGIYCSEELLKTDPELCKKFASATIEGWIAAFEDPEYTLQVIEKYMKEVNVPYNKAHQRWMLNRMKDLIFPGEIKSRFEILSRKDFDFTVSLLLDKKLIKNKQEFSTIYKPVLNEMAK